MINYFKSGAFLNFFKCLVRSTLVVCVTANISVSTAKAGAFEDFFEAIKNNRTSEVAQLLRNGMDSNSVDEAGTPALILAVTHKANDVVKLLLQQRRIAIDATGKTGETALAVAAWHGNQALVEQFLSLGAQINRPGWTPLHYAAAGGHKDLVALLIEKSAYIDAQSPNLTTPLMMAARSRHTHIVQLLIEEGADPSQVNQAGLSAADYLDRHKESDLAAQLRQKAEAFKKKYAVTTEPSSK
jgi:uncharacterized protein